MNFVVADTPKNESVSTDFQLASVLLLMVLFYFNFLPRLIMAPLMVTVEHELHFGHDDSGKFFYPDHPFYRKYICYSFDFIYLEKIQERTRWDVR